MAKVLEGLNPARVWGIFESLSDIPRGSGNEAAVSEWCYNFAKDNGLFAERDGFNNVLIRRGGSAGYENAPTLTLQGHLDMVCQKNADTKHDFTTDPLKLYIDGDFVKARGTTLGADNGIGAAVALAAITDDAINRPPLEVLLTTDEEVGLLGAANMSPEWVTGARFINLDSEEEGIFYASCAGGARFDLRLPIKTERCAEGYGAFLIRITGGLGGHSGMDIDKGRANANKLMGRVLAGLIRAVPETRITFVKGGDKDNAIPREAGAVVALPSGSADLAEKVIKEYAAAFSDEFRHGDGGVTLTMGGNDELIPAYCWDEHTTKTAINILLSTKNGIAAMSFDVAGLVETSLNLGVMQVENDDTLYLAFALRSSVESRLEALIEHLTAVTELSGGSFGLRGRYPGWQYAASSTLRDNVTALYEKMYGTKPAVNAIHAGLECGWFVEKYRRRGVAPADMISMGPAMFDVHTPFERLSVSSVGRFWEFFKSLLATLK